MRKFSLFILSLFLFTSCSSTYYQVYQARPEVELKQEKQAMVYEDQNCEISYNLWSEGGNSGFRFYNKTNEPIYLDLENSFFILNGVAYDYYRQRTTTYSSKAAGSTSSSAFNSSSLSGLNFWNLLQTNQKGVSKTVNMASSGKSVSYEEKKLIIIPPKTSKLISEYEINETLIRNCDLYLYPKKKQIGSVSFSEDSSPISFSNRISYHVGSSTEPHKIENSFYVSEITNYPEKEVTETEYEEFCGEKENHPTTRFTEAGPDKFYVQYTKGTRASKH